MNSKMRLLYLIIVTQCSGNDWPGHTSGTVHVLDEKLTPYGLDKALRGVFSVVTGSHATS